MSEDNTLEMDLGAALDAAMTIPETNESAPQETQTEAPAEAKGQSKGRDESGRFKAKDKGSEVAAEVEPKQEEQQASLPQENQEQEVPQAPTDIRPPTTWTPEAKAAFGNADPIVQKEVLKREQDFQNGINQYKEGYEGYQKVNQAFQPFMATIQSLGVTPEVAIQHLLGVDHKLRYGSPQVKAQTIADISQQFGVDLHQLMAEQPQVDPNVMAMQRELSNLRQTITQQQTQAQNAEQQFVQSEIAKFESDSAHMYFHDVRAEMAALMTSGHASDLKDAYDKACWANPQIRAILLKQQNEDAEKKRLSELANKANTARRASFDVQGAGTTAPINNRALTLEEEIARQF